MTVSVLDHTCLGSGDLSIGTCPATEPLTDGALMDNWGCGRGNYAYSRHAKAFGCRDGLQKGLDAFWEGELRI
eukprot:1159862-Prorocentrum_minimum.AAC.1